MAAPRDIDPETRRRVARLARLARLLDSAVGIPGTRLRFGLDGLIGLLPIAGDAVMLAASVYIVAEAWRLGAPGRILLRMAWTIALDYAIGSIPVLGDLFDFAWKANLRNVALLEAWLDAPVETAPRRR